MQGLFVSVLWQTGCHIWPTTWKLMLAGTVSFVSGNTMRGAAVDVCKNTKQTTKEGKQLLPGRRWHAGGIVMRRWQKGPEYHRMSTKYLHLLSCEMQLLPLSSTLVVYQKVQDSGTFCFSAPKKNKKNAPTACLAHCLQPPATTLVFSSLLQLLLFFYLRKRTEAR